MAWLVGDDPDVVVVTGPAAGTAEWDPGSHLDLSAYAPALGPSGRPGLPLALGLGARLLDQAGYTGRRILQAVSEAEPAAGAWPWARGWGMPGPPAGPEPGPPCWPWATAAPGAAPPPPATWTSGRSRSIPASRRPSGPVTWPRWPPWTPGWPGT